MLHRVSDSGARRNPRKIGAGLLGALVAAGAVALLVVPAIGAPKDAARRAPIAPPTNSVAGLADFIRTAKETGRGKVGFLEAKYWYLRQRAFPSDSVDWSAYDRAATHRRQMGKAGGLDRLAATPPPTRWEFVGPNNLDIPYPIYFGIRPLSGRVNAVAYASADGGLTFTHYWAAGCAGGVWKSEDAGRTWKPMSDGWDTLLVSAIAVNPFDNDIVYVGTGDFHGTGGYSMGIMKTTNGGKTWTNLGRSTFGSSAISKIVVDPEEPDTILVATGRPMGRIYRSTNGGTTFQQALAARGDWYNIVFTEGSGGARTYLAAGVVLNDSTYNAEIWRSRNRGASWEELTIPVSDDQASIDIAVSKISANTIYALFGSKQELHRSTNGGGTWKNITNDFPAGYNWSQSWYDFHINATGEYPFDTVYVGLIDLAQTLNGNASDEKTVLWRSVGGPSYTNNSILHNDQHCMAFHPMLSNDALVGHDGGVYGFKYDPFLDEWSYDYSMNERIGITQFYQAAWHPIQPNKMLGGTQDNATPQCSGDLDNWNNVGGGDGGYCAIHPQTPAVQYATSQFLNIYRTGDEWATSTNITPSSAGFEPSAFIAPIVLDARTPRYLYAGTSYLHRWDDTLQRWETRLGNKKLSLSGVIQAIAVAPSDSTRIYTGSTDGEIFMSLNRGQTWTPIERGSHPQYSLPRLSITSLAVHPTNPSILWVTFSGTGNKHVWRCADTKLAKRVWQAVSGDGYRGLPDIPVNCIAIDPSSPNTLWHVGSDIGVFTTRDGGNTWMDTTNPLGLPNVQVNALGVVPGTGFLNAATFGRGMWRLPLSAVPTGVAIRRISCVPNPVQGGVINQTDPASAIPVNLTIELSAPAPQAGQAVALSSSHPTIANLPASVTVQGGLTTKIVPFTTNEVDARTEVLVTARAGVSTSTTTLSVLPLPIISVAVSPATVRGGQNSTGTVTLRDPAPVGGVSVRITSTNSVATPPSSVYVASGSRTATFVIRTRAGGNATATITAQHMGVTRAASLRVTP